MREPAKITGVGVAEDLVYGDISETKLFLQEVSKLLEVYSRAILNSDY